jgi:hypothetical protein
MLTHELDTPYGPTGQWPSVYFALIYVDFYLEEKSAWSKMDEHP